MVPISEFSQLPLDERAQLLYQKGKFLLCQQGDKYRCSLYALGGFYVELWYNYQADQLVDVIGFNDPEKLDPYLDSISIEGII